MENGKIPSSAITASSSYNAELVPNFARLNSPSAWAIGVSAAPPQWLQVDLGGVVAVKGVATQGRRLVNQWVTSYFVSSSVNGIEWVKYMENNTVKVSQLLNFSHWLYNSGTHFMMAQKSSTLNERVVEIYFNLQDNCLTTYFMM